jgi:hypothetical protein
VFHPDDHIDPSPIYVFHGKISSEGHSERSARMLIQLHMQATTTPKIRTAIHASDEPAWIVAERYGTSEQTVCKWRKCAACSIEC